MMIGVLFVCSGNTCRSPMAQYVFQDLVDKAGISDKIYVDSAGTNVDPHNSTINPRTVETLTKHCIPNNPARAAQPLDAVNFSTFDHVLAMDHRNLVILQQQPLLAHKSSLLLKTAHEQGKISQTEIPDPYGTDQYEQAYSLIAPGCEVFLQSLLNK